MKEIIFLYDLSYNRHERCHAKIVETLSVEKNWKTYVGKIDGYEIYKTYESLFNQFGFEAIKEA